MSIDVRCSQERDARAERKRPSLRSVCLVAAVIMLFAACFSGYAEAPAPSALETFAAEVTEHANRLENSFTVSCDESLQRDLKSKSHIGESATVLSEILKQAGSTGMCSMIWYGDSVRIDDVDYYPGWKLRYYWDQGDIASLSARERELLEAALNLTAGAAGSDLEKERYIYDALCAWVSYEKEDDGSGDKDNAYGALLNRRADCDGYADAMLLCCSVAGIPCRYINGEGIRDDQPAQSAEERRHMWNLVRIQDSWLMCDVTWGDQDREEPDYLYFNIGSRDAGASYRWIPEIAVTPIAPAADFNRQLTPDLRPEVCYTMTDVYQAACRTTAAGKRHLLLYCPEEKLWEADRDAFVSMLYHGAIGQYAYGSSGRLFSVSNIALPDVSFCFCRNKEDALSAIQAFADADVHSFVLYFDPSVSEKIFANDHAELRQMLGESCLKESGSYSYSEEGGRVMLTDVSFADPLPVCRSAEEIVALLRRALSARPASVSFVLGEGLGFEAIQDDAAAAVYAMGVKSFRYQWGGNRVTILDLHYYENCCFAETEDDVAAFMRSIRESGKSDMHIYCTENLYALLMNDNASAFFSMLKQAGFREYAVFYNDNHRMIGAKDIR